MIGQERRTKLKSNERLNLYWKIILGLQLLAAVLVLFGGLIGGAAGLAFGGAVGVVAAMVWVVVILTLAIIALIAWGVYNIERWVVILMWISFIFGILGILGKFNWNNLVQLGISAFTLFSYRAILALVNPKIASPSAPTAAPTPKP